MIAPARDIDRIMAVMAAGFDPVFGEAWTRAQVESALLAGNCHYRLAAADGREPALDEPAAAFYLSRHGYGEEELLLIAVDPAHRRRGIARSLIAHLAGEARGRGAERLLLEVRQGNGAEALYRAIGFEQIGTRSNYYRGPDGGRLDANTLALTLD